MQLYQLWAKKVVEPTTEWFKLGRERSMEEGSEDMAFIGSMSDKMQEIYTYKLLPVGQKP